MCHCNCLSKLAWARQSKSRCTVVIGDVKNLNTDHVAAAVLLGLSRMVCQNQTMSMWPEPGGCAFFLSFLLYLFLFMLPTASLCFCVPLRKRCYSWLYKVFPAWESSVQPHARQCICVVHCLDPKYQAVTAAIPACSLFTSMRNDLSKWSDRDWRNAQSGSAFCWPELATICTPKMPLAISWLGSIMLQSCLNCNYASISSLIFAHCPVLPSVIGRTYFCLVWVWLCNISSNHRTEWDHHVWNMLTSYQHTM